MLNAINYYAVFLYGLFIMLFLLNIKNNRRTRIVVMTYAIASGLLMQLLYHYFGAEFVTKAYPFIIHIPVVLLFCVFFNKRFVSVLFALCVAYVLTTPRKWLGTLIALPLHNNLAVSVVSQIIISIILLYLIYKYLRPAVITILEYSGSNLILLTVIPFIYYLVAYATTVYSNLLYQTNVVVIGFLASGITYVFFAFLVTYFNEIRKNIAIQYEQKFFKVQALATELQLEQMRDLQMKTSIYRHDLRHHLNLINSCIKEQKLEEATNYIALINSTMDNAVMVIYCEHETANLILSYYISKAQSRKINVIHEVSIPSEITISPTDICVVLANGLENAIHAAEQLTDTQKREIKISCHIKNGKLLIEIVNYYSGNIIFENGIPQNFEEGHGIGTQSIIAACEKYNGIYSFHVKSDLFTLRAIL